MKNILLLLVLSTYLSTNKDGQTQNTAIATIEYNLDITWDGLMQRKVIVNCTKSKSLSKTVEKKVFEGKRIDKNTETIHINQKLDEEYQLTDNEKKTVTVYSFIQNQDYKFIEESPMMLWKLSKKGETKKIDNFVCNKATLTFRGRNYIAWYCPKIPLSFGPWKFKGLPGLILEIADDENHYHWIVSKLVYPSNNISNINIPESKNVKEISFKQFVDKEESIKNAMLAKILKLLPRGAIADKGNNKRRSIELVYDWEKKK